MATNTVYGLRDCDRFVYHYTTAATALEHVLKDRTILLNWVTSTNDPRETRDWRLVGYTPGMYVDGTFDSEIRRQVAAELRRPVFLACFSRDISALTGDHHEDVLKRGLAKARMWDQYGDKHRGFCLIFDRQELLTQAEIQFGPQAVRAGNVQYRNCSAAQSIAPNAFRIELHALGRLGLTKYCELHRSHYMQDLFFEKLEDWRDENEWRLAVVRDSERPLLLKFGEALAGVVHGMDVDPAQSEEALKLVGDDGTDHLFMTWSSHGAWYDLGNSVQLKHELAKLKLRRTQT